ncbi:hypothetical protein [Kitasatospora sp. NBC_01266]|uniref:hypothetical protein n=1 Tax=Kitasatospora sp. NBC_01266 TaxID=2903572 RepID=UPI002E2FB437|nr:hypothetical protein [Kitasatospora sp. NBC_01266]
MRTSEHPAGQAVSPDLLLSRAVLTEGRLLQASVRVRIASAGGSLRLPWGHYLAWPGLARHRGAGWVTGGCRPGGRSPVARRYPRTGRLDLGRSPSGC